MSAPRMVFALTVEICPEDQQHIAKSARTIQVVKVYYAGPLQFAHSDVEGWLWVRKFYVMKHIACDPLRKAKGREGPGVLSSEPELDV
jgi:hypothetical protein